MSIYETYCKGGECLHAHYKQIVIDMPSGTPEREYIRKAANRFQMSDPSKEEKVLIQNLCSLIEAVAKMEC